jgi:TolB-like protein
MKIKSNGTVIFSLLIIIFTYSHSIAQEKKIAIIDFQEIRVSNGIGKAVSEILMTKIVEFGNYDVVERALINKIMEEQQLQQTGIVDENTAIEIGKLIGASYIVIGSVVKTGELYTVNARIVSTETGITAIAKSISFHDESEIPNICNKIAYSLKSKTAKDSITSIYYPGYLVSGITFDDYGYLWVADWSQGVGTRKIYCIEVSSNKIIKEINAPSNWPGGLAYTGESLWVVDSKGICKIDQHNGNILIKIDTHQSYGQGLASDGSFLYYADNSRLDIINIQSKKIERVLTLPEKHAHGGLTFDGLNLWFVSKNSPTIYKINITDGKILFKHSLSGLPENVFAHDLAWDGESIWVSLAKRSEQGYYNWITKLDNKTFDPLCFISGKD